MSDQRPESQPYAMEPKIEYEVFEEDKPTYIPCYMMSAFVLVGIFALLEHPIPIWPFTVAHVVLAIWFGVFFKWILDYARQQKRFRSHRLVVTDKEYSHASRYSLQENESVKIPLSEIKTVKITSEEPASIAITTGSDFDIFFVPPSADLTKLKEAMRAGNSGIQFKE